MSNQRDYPEDGVIVIEAPLRLKQKAYSVKRIIESLGYEVQIKINPEAEDIKVIVDTIVLYDYNYAYLFLLEKTNLSQKRAR
ncbi:MAG: hypothetical protein GSR85_00720 [Desulfurococcales archaeon]|nr:hypothetical protein [Desulfurococcales archaeon]